MSEATQTQTPRRIAKPLQLVCTEVWGGNRPIDAPVELPGLHGRIFSQPCSGGRGGDIHYLSVCDSGLVARLCLADVAGHGEAVSRVSTTIHRLLRRHINWPDQRRVLVKLNRQLERIGLQALTTAAAVTYYPPWRWLSVSYAGHPPAWLYRRSEDRWDLLVSRPGKRFGKRFANLPLAADADTVFTRTTVKVSEGDRLFVLTDGVLETPDAEGQLLGAERFEELLHRERHAPPAALADSIIDALRRRAGEAGLVHDDVTFLLMEVVPGPRGPSVWHAVKNRILRPRGNSGDDLFADPRPPEYEAAAG